MDMDRVETETESGRSSLVAPERSKLKTVDNDNTIPALRRPLVQLLITTATTNETDDSKNGHSHVPPSPRPIELGVYSSGGVMIPCQRASISRATYS